MTSPMYKHPMPTELLKDRIAELTAALDISEKARAGHVALIVKVTEERNEYVDQLGRAEAERDALREENTDMRKRVAYAAAIVSGDTDDE